MKEEAFLNYASALFSLAKEENEVETYLQEIGGVTEILTSDKEIKEVFSSYSLDKEKLDNLLDKTFKNLESPSLLPFLKLLLNKHLLGYLNEINDSFASLANEYLGVKEGIIYSTSNLSNEEIKEIEKILAKKLDAKVFLKNKIDPNIIGGVKVAIDGKIFDGSVEMKLERLRHKLLKGDAL